MFLERRYYEMMMKDLNKEDRSGGVHITELVYECPRKMSFVQMYKGCGTENVDDVDVKKMNILWLGKKYHEIPISNAYLDRGKWKVIPKDIDVVKNMRYLDGRYYIEIDGRLYPYGYEFPFALERKGIKIVGRIDDIVLLDDVMKIVDKKTTTTYQFYSTYKKQLKYYSVAMNEIFGIEKIIGSILFINNKSKYSFDVREVEYEFDIDAARNEFDEKVEMVKRILDEKVILKRKMNEFDCRYCPFKKICSRIGDEEVYWDEVRK